MLPLLAAMLPLLLPPPPAAIAWEKGDLDAALQRAKAENRVIFIAINMDGERANDELVAEHYRDPVLVKLSERTINLFCSKFDHGKGGCPRAPGLDCAGHQRLEIQVRERILKADSETWVIAPQHLFLAPTGEVISSVAYFVTKGELEWMWVEAIRKVDPAFAWTPSGRARAPGRLRQGEQAKAETDAKPPTREEVDSALKEIKAMRGGFRRVAELVLVVVRSPEKEAMKFVANSLSSVPDPLKVNVLRAIGRSSPKPWWEVVAPYLEAKTDRLRREAAVALERLNEPRAMPALQKAWRQEKEPATRGRLLRAMAAVEPAKPATAKLVGDILRTDKSDLVRAHAVVAAGLLEDRKAVVSCLGLAEKDPAPKVRATFAYAVAIRRDREMIPYLKVLLGEEKDPEVKEWAEKALATLEGGDATPFRSFLETVLGDDPERGGGPWDGGGAQDGGMDPPGGGREPRRPGGRR